jgi:hypothetical protein
MSRKAMVVFGYPFTYELVNNIRGGEAGFLPTDTGVSCAYSGWTRSKAVIPLLAPSRL